MVKCNKCAYAWESRTSSPKACPRCKNRLDYVPKRLKRITPIIMEVR